MERSLDKIFNTIRGLFSWIKVVVLWQRKVEGNGCDMKEGSGYN